MKLYLHRPLQLFMANENTPGTANAVNVMDIVDARSVEITAAMDAVKTNMSVSYRLSIPFYMRRRAASHNPKRVPARVRPQGMEKTKTKYKWKQERRKKEQEGKAVRLETHVWHAKRCHMVDIWGYRIAMTTTQKGARAAYRAALTSTTICDTSYFIWYSLQAECLHAKLSGVLEPNPLLQNRVLHSHLYHGTVCLGPVSVLWVSESCAFVRCHPAIPHETDLSSVFNGINLISYANQLSQYTLDGVKSMELIVKSLKLSSKTDAAVGSIWDEFIRDPFHYDIMKGTVLGCHVEVPAKQFIPFRSVVTDSLISQPSTRLTPSSSLQGDTLFKTLLCGTDQVMQCDTPLESSGPAVFSENETSSVPACIFKDSYSGCITVVVPGGYGTRFWIPLIYNGGRLIGLEDGHSLATDRKITSFPHDYPDTPAEKSYHKRVGSEAEAKEMRRPPQKRVRYEELGIACPFISDWSAVSGSTITTVIRYSKLLDRLDTLPPSYDTHFVAVSLECVKRGNIKPGAHIYSPQSTPDLNSTDPVHSPTSAHQLVGYVTSAKYCLSTGRGCAMGLVVCSVLRGRGESVTLLVRNTTTTQYRNVTMSHFDHIPSSHLSRTL